jgi:hypothetical protein
LTGTAFALGAHGPLRFRSHAVSPRSREYVTYLTYSSPSG